MSKKHFRESISNVQTEEELKFAFVKYFDLPFSTKNRIDLYTAQILFEFKLDDNLKNQKILAKTVAQALYYIRRLKFGDDNRTPSENICVVAKNFAAVFKTETFADFYSNSAYDWDLKPSSPCKKLVADLSAAEMIIRAHVYDFSAKSEEIAFVTLINQTRERKSSLFRVKKQITAQNFYQVFQHWLTLFGDDVKNGHKPSEYFITDIEKDKSSLVDDKSVLFRMAGGERIEKLVNPDEYKYFWSTYEKVSSAREIISIRQKMDRMTEINLRRFTGEFYTPQNFAKKAFDYLTRTVKIDENFRIWDMAAGTGNLEFAIPPEIIKNCYISTLIDDEANYCRQIFSEATVFQYDFLNDDADKLPKNLRDDLNNPEIRWILFINPPYATGNDAKRIESAKRGVSETAIKLQMDADNLKSASRELFSQFIYRISKDFAGKKAWLGIFSKLKYIRSEREHNLRDKVFKSKFERGFVFNSRNFNGCNGQFPVGFLVWNLSERISLEEQTILLDIYDSDVEKVGEKILKPARVEELLNRWFERPKQTKKFPPLSSALNFSTENKIIRADRVAERFLASFMCVASDFSHQNFTSLLSAPYINPGAFSITPENFEQAMIIHMVRRLPKANWLNDRDQFMQPTKKLTPEFISDAVVWSLFSPSNQTVSLRNVEYEGEIYRMQNNFYPFLLSEVRSWDCSAYEIVRQVDSEVEDRFAALWLKNHELSAQSQAVLSQAREIYRKFYAELRNLDVAKWKIADWDAGWYQIRMSLVATIDLSDLTAKLEPQIYELGFLRDEVRYF